MVTARDEFSNLRNRLLKEKENLDMRSREIQSMLQVLEEAPKVLSEIPAEPRQDRAPAKTVVTGTRLNLTFTKDIEEYVASFPYDKTISVNAMIETLRQEKGLQGKQRSLYAYALAVLKRLAVKNAYGLQHEAGVGYSRSRKKLPTDRNDSELVHSA